VFAPQCVACHTAGTDAARQSGLLLDGPNAFANLVNAQPTNANARADGMLRVKPFDPLNSLLFHKLQWDATHHARDYGSPMPLGGQSLSLGQIEFVTKWISAGAPREGEVAAASLLDDRTPPFSSFAPLPKPAAGYQLKIDQFAVRPNFERELFVYRRVGNTTPIYVNRIETKMRPNSHHLLLRTFRANTPAVAIPLPDLVRDIRNSDGSLNFLNMVPMAYHVFFAGSMTPSADYTLPEGVALRLPANAMLDLNSHYVNRTNVEIPGEAYINLHTVDSAQVRHLANTLDFGNDNLVIPPRARTVITKEFPITTTMRILTLTAHMHERGERFVIRVTGGGQPDRVVYTTTDWAHPDIVTFTTPLVVQPGQSLVSEVTYNNTSDRTINFGLTSQDEMAIIFGYWY